MNRKSKYIVVKHEGFEMPIVFSDLMQHTQAAGLREVIGAGFCYVEAGEYVCYGESIGLHVKSRGETDASVLNEMLGMIREE